MRFELPGSLIVQAENPSTFIAYEPARIESLTPSLVYLDPNPAARQLFRIRGRLLGDSSVITSVQVGGLECRNVSIHLDGLGLNCTAGLSGYVNNHVEVIHGGVRSQGGADLLEYTVPPRIAGATPAEIPVAGGINVSFFGYIGSSQSQIGEVFIGERPCLQWTVQSEVVLECLAPPGTGSALKASILSPAGVRTFSAFPLVSYEAPELDSVHPRELLSNPTARYNFLLTGRNFGAVQSDLVEAVVGGVRCPNPILENTSAIRCDGVGPPWISNGARVTIAD